MRRERGVMVLHIMVVALFGLTESGMLYGSDRAFQIVRHDTNQVMICISNYGRFGQDESGFNQGCWWPIGTGHAYIFGAGLWFGTVDSMTGDTLVTVGYDYVSDTFTGCYSEFVPGLEGMPFNHPAAIIYTSPDNWPPPETAYTMAPQTAISHQDSWCCFNDCDSTYHASGDTRPIGIETYQTVYVWDIPLLEDLVFHTYEIKNVSGHLLSDCFVGIRIDGNIGNILNHNDQCSGIVGQWYTIGGDSIWVDNICYYWQPVEEPSAPPWWPGTIGFDLLQTPFDLVEGMDKDGDGILDQYERDSAYYVNNLPQYLWDVDNDGVPDWRDPSQWPQLGMTALKKFRMFQSLPSLDPERFLTMAGYNFVTGQYEPYDTAAGWPDEWCALISTGPFELSADSSITVISGIMFADWHDDYLRPDTALALIDQRAQDYYDMYWYLYTGIEENCEFRISNCGLTITPSPVLGRATVSYSLPRKSNVSMKLYNTAGQLVSSVLDEYKSAGKYSLVFDCTGLPQGSYFLVLETPYFEKSQSLVVLR